MTSVENELRCILSIRREGKQFFAKSLLQDDKITSKEDDSDFRKHLFPYIYIARYYAFL
jgi:hypothetical protein